MICKRKLSATTKVEETLIKLAVLIRCFELLVKCTCRKASRKQKTYSRRKVSHRKKNFMQSEWHTNAQTELILNDFAANKIFDSAGKVIESGISFPTT